MRAPSCLAQIIEQAFDLPSLPALCQEVMAVAGNARSSARDLAAIIESDPGVSANLIRECNGPSYGFPRRIDSVLQAIVLLGDHEVRNIVTVASTAMLFKQPNAVDQRLRKQALGTASIARQLAQRYAPEARRHAYLAGQMLHIGLHAMRTADPDRYARVEREAGDSGDVDGEAAEYGFTHADVGALLAARWNLPVDIESASFFHHDVALCQSTAPDQVSLVACVVIADFLCRQLGIGVVAIPCAVPVEVNDALEVLHFTPRELPALLEIVGPTARAA